MIPWFQFTVIHLGPIPIQVWGLFVALGMLLSLMLLSRRAKRAGVDPEFMLEMALWAIVGGLIGARLFHIVLYQPAYYLSFPGEIVKIWHGGLSSFGGLFGAAAAFFLFLKYQKRFAAARNVTVKQLVSYADLLSFAAVYGWMLGRVGCFMIHDHLGVHANCPLAMGTPDGPRLDMALLEIIGMVPLAVLFFAYRRRALAPGWYTAVLFVYYGILRFVLDFFRARDIVGADTRYLGLTPGQYTAILLMLLGGYLFITIRKTNIPKL